MRGSRASQRAGPDGRSNLIAGKLSDLADHLERVRTRRKPSAQALAQDRDALDLVAFNLMLAVQTCAGGRAEMLHAAATTGLDDLEAFAREIAAWTRTRT